MPLSQGKSKKSFEKNIKSEMEAGKPQKQALAIAYSVKRKSGKKKMAMGGAAMDASNSNSVGGDAHPNKVDKAAYPRNFYASGGSISHQNKALSEAASYPDGTDMDATDMAKNRKPNFAMGGEPVTGNSNAPWGERVDGSKLIHKPNLPGPSNSSYMSKSLNDMAPPHGSSPAQMAEYHQQMAQKYHMMANGGSVSNENYPYEMDMSLANGGPVQNPDSDELEGEAQADQDPGPKPRVPNDHRFPESEYMGKDWSYGNPPAPKPDDQRPDKDEYDNGHRARYADGGQIVFRDDKSKNGKGGNVYTREPGQPAPKPDDRRLNKDDYNAENWAAGPDPERKPDDERRPKKAFLNTNYWSDLIPPNRKNSYAKGGEVENYDLEESEAPMDEDDARDVADKAKSKKIFAEGGRIEERNDPIPDPSSIKGEAKAYRSKMEKVEMNKGGRMAKGGIADAIMKKKRYADGGRIEGIKKENYENYAQSDRIDSDEDDTAPMRMRGHKEPKEDQVDIDRNAREDQNHEDDLSFNSLNRESYSEQSALDDLDSPMDSNEHGDDREDESENKHDRIEAIRSKMRMRKVGQRYSER